MATKYLSALQAAVSLTLKQQPDLVKTFLRILWKVVALPPEDEKTQWPRASKYFLEMCEKTHHKRLINLLAKHRDFFEPAFTELYRKDPPSVISAICFCQDRRAFASDAEKHYKKFHHDLKELTKQLRDILPD